jgi:riboflavin synthase
MFSGLVQTVGRIESVQPRHGGVRIRVLAAGLARPKVGDSIAINGCCLTAASVVGTAFEADVSDETLSKTVHLDECGAVNLEASLALGDPLGGHLVSGHVDGIGTVASLRPVGDSRELVLDAPPVLAPMLAVKGSVAVDGVSLTINGVVDRPDACRISINLIPHTLAVTTLGRLGPGSKVNLEVDLLARYASRILACHR